MKLRFWPNLCFKH